MRPIPTSILVASTLLTAASAFGANAQWTADVNFAVGKRASIKILSPKGMKLMFREFGADKEDTVPRVVGVADEDAFVPITFIAEDGERFSDKIEVKHGQVSEVKITYTPKVVPPAILKGKVQLAGACAAPIKFDVRGAKTATKKAFTIQFGTTSAVSLPKDSYEVTVLSVENGAERKISSKNLELVGDGFYIGFQCAGPNSQFVVRAAPGAKP